MEWRFPINNLNAQSESKGLLNIKLSGVRTLLLNVADSRGSRAVSAKSECWFMNEDVSRFLTLLNRCYMEIYDVLLLLHWEAVFYSYSL